MTLTMGELGQEVDLTREEFQSNKKMLMRHLRKRPENHITTAI